MNDEQDHPQWKRGFWSLFVVQFQGAFSDNVFKFLVIFIITSAYEGPERDNYIAALLAVFSLPFLLFSMAAGYLADRYPKPRIIVCTKLLECAIMIGGTIGLCTLNPLILGVVLFFMSVQSAFFGPSKYGLLPELLSVKRLSWGNGIILFGTYFSIITGGIVAGLLRHYLGNEFVWISGLGLVALAAIGFLFSREIPALPAADPEKEFHANFLAELWRNLRAIRHDRVLMLALCGSVFFWFIAALFGEPAILIYGKDVMALSDPEVGELKACLGVGIALGCALAGYVSGKHIEHGLIPIGALGMAAASAALFIPGLGFTTVAIILWLMGFFGGFYDVPIMALLQHQPDPANKGTVLAANNWLTSAGVFAASGIFWLLKSQLALSAPAIFLLGGIVTAGVGLFSAVIVGPALSAFLRRMARLDFTGESQAPPQNHSPDQ